MMLEMGLFSHQQHSAGDTTVDPKCIQKFAILKSKVGGVWVECELQWSRKASRNTDKDTGEMCILIVPRC